jgi:tetraacyldisaccharide 4'-kinase
MNRFNLERRLQEIWYGESSGFSVFLQPLAWLFGLLAAVRRFAYRKSLVSRRSVGVPVLVVGNISVGGTGKTPVVGWLISYLVEAGYRPGIVSRGYGGRAGERPTLVTTDSDYHDVGDEALLLARRTNVPVCVCTQRVAGAMTLVEAGVDIVVSDDGLQHYALIRDIEIAVVDGVRGLGNRRLLPAGPLREPPARLAEVDLVLVNGASDAIPGYRFDLVPGDVVALADGRHCALAEFRGKKVWSVAGIGHPERFASTLNEAGIEAVAVNVPDHGTTSLEQLRERHPWPILMTEKDAVKYSDTAIKDAWYLPVEVRMSGDAQRAVKNCVKTLKENNIDGFEQQADE